MSTDYKAIAVIGAKISLEKIPNKKVKTKLFGHHYPESMNYCPDTGKKLWSTRNIPFFTFDAEYAEDEETEVIKLPKGIKCFVDWNFETEAIEGYLLGMVLESDKEAFMPIAGKLKETLKSFFAVD